MESRNVPLEIDVERVHCAFFGMGLAMGLVLVTFWASVVSVSLVKKGIPETMNTFADSANRVFGRLYDQGLADLVFNPEDLGFRFADRMSELTDATARHSKEYRKSELTLSGSNLDMVRTISLGNDRYTTEAFKYDAALGQLTLPIQNRDLESLPDEVAVIDVTGERSSRPLTKLSGDLFAAAENQTPKGSNGSNSSSGSSSSSGHQQTSTAATAVPPKDRFAADKQAVFAILGHFAVRLDDTHDRQLRDHDFRTENRAILRLVLLKALDDIHLTPDAKRRCVRELLASSLYQQKFRRIDAPHLDLLASWKDLKRIETSINQEPDPCEDLLEIRIASATPDPTQPQHGTVLVQPAEFRAVFKAEEPFRECVANQQKILRAAEAATAKGDSEGAADLYALVRKNYLPAMLSCPAGGRYQLDRTGALDVACSVHGNSGAPAESHRKFALLFDTYEKARELMAREGATAKAVEMLQAEHDRQPQNPYVGYLLGRARVDLGEYEAGHTLLKPLSDDNSANINYSYPCGYAFYATGNVQLAGAMLDRAARATWEASREEISGKAEFYLMQDKAAWVLRKATGQVVGGTSGGGDEPEPAERPMKFLDFKQMGEPKYPTQVCLEGLQALEKALGPVLEAFLTPEMKERWGQTYQKYAASRDKKDLAALERLLQSLSKEYLGLLQDVPSACPAKGFYYLEVQGTKAILQCSVHKDLEPDATATLEADTPAWQVKAVDNLLFYLLRRKNEELDRCLTNQERIAARFAAWDDPRVTPDLDTLVRSGGVPEKSIWCPAGQPRPRYRLSKQGKVECRNHISAGAVEKWLADWPGANQGH